MREREADSVNNPGREFQTEGAM